MDLDASQKVTMYGEFSPFEVVMVRHSPWPVWAFMCRGSCQCRRGPYHNMMSIDEHGVKN